MNCQNCGTAFADGDTAYEQHWGSTQVSGTTVTMETVRIVVCESCA